MVDLPFFLQDFILPGERSTVSTMAGTSSNPIVIDCTSSPETSLSPLKLVKAKEMYRYVHLIDIISGTVYCIGLLVICRRVFEELSSESESEDTSELTCKKNLFCDAR